jgi:thioredoxin-like negative regulator of GroEL
MLSRWILVLSSLLLCVGLLGWSQSLAGTKPVSKFPALPKELRVTNKFVLLDFYAEWCGYCKQLEPSVKQLQTEFANKLQVVYVDVDQPQNVAYADQFGINVTPTLILFDPSGKAVLMQRGGVKASVLRQAVQKKLGLIKTPIVK